MQKLIYVGIGGCLGAVARYIISVVFSKAITSSIPLGTLCVNMLGGLLIGFIMELSITTEAVSPNLKLFLTTGIMGGLTTFSTFSYETITLFKDGNMIYGMANICLNLLLSFGGVVLGQYIASKIII